MVHIIVDFLTKAMETRTYNLANVPKGVLVGVVDFFDEALKAVCFRGLLCNDTSYICTEIFVTNHGALVEEKMVYDLVRYGSFFTQVTNWNHPVLEDGVPHLQELLAFFTTFKQLGDSEDPWTRTDDDE